MPAIESRPWAELTFHVLAHAAGTAKSAASVHDAVYVAFAAQHLGPAGERNLGEDAAVLGRVLAQKDDLVRAQLVARLFSDLEQASRYAAVDLGELAARGVVGQKLALALEPISAAAELLRTACELERAAFERLPAADFEPRELAAALDDAQSVAPGILHCTVAALRSLRLRGRAFPGEIWVGAPSASLALLPEHVVWQACHEATVLELHALAPPGAGERALEHAAVVVLAARARAAGREREHRRWLSHFGANAPTLETDQLPVEVKALAELPAAARSRT